jgi:nitroreductase
MEYDLASIDYILETTRSVRKRLDLTRLVDQEVVMKCLDIALQAPSASNSQNWKWLVVTDSEKKAKIGSYYRQAFNNYVASFAKNSSGDSQPSKDQLKLASSASYLAEHMGEVPMMIFACIPSPGANRIMGASQYGSIMPAAWSLMLALRARGIGAAWTTLHLSYEKECNEILGIPDNMTTAVLLPVAYFTGKTFRRAKRIPASELVYLESWGLKKEE